MVTQPTPHPACDPLPQGTIQQHFLCSLLLPLHRQQNRPVPPRQPRLRAAKQRPNPFFHPHQRVQPRGTEGPRPRSSKEQAPDPPWSSQSCPENVREPADFSKGRFLQSSAALRCAESSLQSANLGTGSRPRCTGHANAGNENGFSGFCRENAGWESRKRVLRLNMPELQRREPTAAPGQQILRQCRNLPAEAQLHFFFPSGLHLCHGQAAIQGNAIHHHSKPRARHRPGETSSLQSLLFWLIPSNTSECKPCPAVFATQILQH